MNIEEQLKQLVDDTITEQSEENDEVEVSWVVEQSNLSDEEKLAKLKDIAQYSLSEEFKSIVKKFHDKIPEVHNEIKEIAFSRTETKATKSILDEYVVSLNATKEIADATTNEILRDYLIKARCEAFESAIINKK